MTERWGGGGRNLTWRQLRDTMVGTGISEVGKPRHLRAVSDAEPPPPPPPPPAPVAQSGGYAELHAHSNFSFLDGASSPEALVTEAARLGLSGLAVTDHDGMYGVVRFSRAARDTTLDTVYGAELSLDLTGERAGVPDPSGTHLLALARDPGGYARLSSVIGTAHLDGGEKGRPDYGCLERVAEQLRDHVVVLTGCRKGPVRRALTESPAAAHRELKRLVELFGRDNVVVELTDHLTFTDADRNRILADLAADLHLPVVATNNVHYARPARHRLSQVVASIRANTPLDDMDGWLSATPSARLCSPAEMLERFAPFPGAVATSVRLARELAFDLKHIAPKLPPFDVPDGHDEASWLRQLVADGAKTRYGAQSTHPKVTSRLEHELDLITSLGFPGYFLTVRNIVEFCENANILVQGRGSAANSVVCYCLGITATDPVKNNLLFERFMSRVREGPPDIDLDIEARRREEVIQYVFDKYGRTHAAQVANVITYRRRSAIRDVATALGYSPGQVDAWVAASPRRGGPILDELPADIGTYANQLLDAPRHLGIHSGGMVMCDRPVIEVVPVEHARMADRTVLQWDKDDCAEAELVKFDLLGLGMLTALHEAADLASVHYGHKVEPIRVPPQVPEVYKMIQAGDSIGTFQIESRAQIQLAPRLKADCLYDLAVQIALVRPGPIQGGAVHPFVRRRRGEEPITYPHDSMRDALERTLGVPLFQEQMMQLAGDCAGFTPSDADELRQAMGSKRSLKRMQELKPRFISGAIARGLTPELAEDLWIRLEAFSGYGFPESHALSFAQIAYASAYLKRFYPAAFLAGLIRAQPMGFYSVNTLIADARRHGVTVLPVHINHSTATTTLDGTGTRSDPTAAPADWGTTGPAVRLGLDQVRGIDTDTAERIATERPFTSITDLARRSRLTEKQLENLSLSGALSVLDLDRRQALWLTAPATSNTPDTLAGTTPETAPTLPGMSAAELTAADLATTGAAIETHPITHIRDQLTTHGAIPINRLPRVANGSLITIGGIVTHRQAPETANGVLFLNLEDETGIVNIVCPAKLRESHTWLAHRTRALLIRGRLERREGAVSIKAKTLTALKVEGGVPIRDFR